MPRHAGISASRVCQPPAAMEKGHRCAPDAAYLGARVEEGAGCLGARRGDARSLEASPRRPPRRPGLGELLLEERLLGGHDDLLQVAPQGHGRQGEERLVEDHAVHGHQYLA